MTVPTSFSDAQTRYEAIQNFNIADAINDLKGKLTNYVNVNTATPRVAATVTTAEDAVSVSFYKISQYYNEVSDINTFLQSYVNKQVVSISGDSSPNGERYENRVHPEEAVLAREVTRGLLPELRVRSLPYLLAMSVFMASLTIFLIFQIFGFSGQVNIPSSITGVFSSPASPIPFYSNPLFLGGAVILLLVAVVIFAVLYFKAKNANK